MVFGGLMDFCNAGIREWKEKNRYSRTLSYVCIGYINKMKLYFENAYGKVRQIGKIDGRMRRDSIKEETFRQIRKFCEEHNYNIPYIRIWNEPLNGKPATKFDVGSHTEFFYAVPEIVLDHTCL